MLCSSSTLACLDWLCNGNGRFITPAGVANHRRQGARGERGGWAEAGCMSVHADSPWLTAHRLTHQACSLTCRYTDWHASSHTCKHVDSDMTHMQTQAPCLPPSTQRPSWEDERKRSHVSSSLSCCFEVSVLHVWEPESTHTNQKRAETEKWICRWPKITITMKRKRGCVSSASSHSESKWMKDHRAEGRAEGRVRREQSCYIKFLLGQFHLTKPSFSLLRPSARWGRRAHDRVLLSDLKDENEV